MADDDLLQDALGAVRWAYEREEETARLYHNRAQLVLTVVSAFLGVGVLRLGTVGERGELLTPNAALLLAILLVVFLVSSMVAALFALAGSPSLRARRGPHVAGKLVLSPEHLDDVAAGRREPAFVAILAQSADALRELSGDNEVRRREIQTALSWFMLALLSAALAVAVYFFGYVEFRVREQISSDAPREVVRMLPSHEG